MFEKAGQSEFQSKQAGLETTPPQSIAKALAFL